MHKPRQSAYMEETPKMLDRRVVGNLNAINNSDHYRNGSVYCENPEKLVIPMEFINKENKVTLSIKDN